MTLTIKTESKEEIKIVYFSDYEFARIGKYVFPSRNLCNLIKEIAENPNSREGMLFGSEPSNIEIIGRFPPFDEYGRIKTIHSRKDRVIGSESLDQNDMVFPLEFNKIIPIKIDEDYRSINIGDYKISSMIGWFIAYLTFGSWTHWGVPFRRKTAPEFAEQASLAVRNSENLLFKPEYVN